MLGRGLGGLGVVMLGLDVVAMSEMSMVAGLVVVAVFVMLRRFVVMLGSVLVMLGGVGVVLGGGVRVVHGPTPLRHRLW